MLLEHIKRLNQNIKAVSQRGLHSSKAMEEHGVVSTASLPNLNRKYQIKMLRIDKILSNPVSIMSVVRSPKV